MEATKKNQEHSSENAQVVIPVGHVAAARNCVKTSCDKAPSLAGNMFVDQEIAEKKLKDFTMSVGVTETGGARKLVSDSKWIRKDQVKNGPRLSTPNREIDPSAAQNVAENPFRQLDKMKPQTPFLKEGQAAKSATFVNNRFVKSNVKRKKPAKMKNTDDEERKVLFKNSTEEDTVELDSNSSSSQSALRSERPQSDAEALKSNNEAGNLDLKSGDCTSEVLCSQLPSSTDHERTGCFAERISCFPRRAPGNLALKIRQTKTDDTIANIHEETADPVLMDIENRIEDEPGQKDKETYETKSERPQTQNKRGDAHPLSPSGNVLKRIFKSCM